MVDVSFCQRYVDKAQRYVDSVSVLAYMKGMKRVRCRFQELLNAKAEREKRKISVRRAAAEAGITWRIAYGMANDTITEFPRQSLEQVCAYLDCEVSELIVLEEVA